MKQVSWNVAVVEKGGMSLKNYLNEHNFQPGKFFVLDDGYNWQVYYEE